MEKINLVLVIVVVLLAGALLFNGYLLKEFKRAYTMAGETRLDPLGLETYGQDRQANDPVLTDVLLLGDSGIRRWTPDALPGMRFHNRGIGGQTSAQVLGRFEAQIDPARYDLILLHAGINDLKMIPLLPGSYADIVERCKANMTRLLQKAEASGRPVILVPLFPLGEVPLLRRPLWSGDVEKARREVNRYLRTLAGKNVRLLDPFDAIGETGYDHRYNADLLHLNEAGYARLNQALTRLLASRHEGHE